MNLTAKVEGLDDVKAMLQQLGRNAPVALRMGANGVGEHMQGAMRRGLPARFTFRGTSGGFSQAIVLSKATGQASRLQTVLRVGSDSPGRSRTKMLGQILARHEEASQRSSSQSFRTTQGGTATGFFIPAAGLRTRSKGVPKSLFPSAIGAAQRRQVDGSYGYAKSTRKTTKRKVGESFVVTERGIFRYRHEAGFSRSLPEPIWWFSKHVRTPARLRLWETAQEVFDRFAVGYLVEAIDLITERSS